MQTVTDDARYAQLIEKAKQARENAYVPYSKFPVGAAILFADGEISSGCNVENASFGLTICAERNAMCAAVSRRATKPVAVAVVGEDGILCPPCGACRQFLYEFNPEMPVILQDGKTLLAYTLSELLPVSFSATELDGAE